MQRGLLAKHARCNVHHRFWGSTAKERVRHYHTVSMLTSQAFPMTAVYSARQLDGDGLFLEVCSHGI